MCIMSSSVPQNQPRHRISTPVFIVGFGALFIACIVLAVGVINYESGASERMDKAASTASSPRAAAVTTVTGSDGKPSASPVPKPAPPETSEEQVRASIRTHFIADAKTTRTFTGVAVTGDVTELALTDLPEFTGHVSRLLEQNCVDSLGLTTPDNVRVTFNGFCYSTLPAETIQRMLTVALDGEADSIDYAHNPAYGNSNYVTMTWYTDSENAAKRIHETWNDVRRPRAVEEIRFYTYSPEMVHRLTRARGKVDTWWHDPMIAQDHGV